LKQLLTIVLFLLFGFSLTAQNLITVTGKVLQKSDSVPIFNAHIYFEGEAIGTTTNENGEFVFHFDAMFRNNFITVSSIGFVSENISTKDVNNHILIFLEEDQLMLASVTVTAIEPIQILKNVVKNIETNYPQEKFSKEIYYKEAFKVNGEPLRYLEIVADLVGKGFSIKRQNPYKYDLFIKEKRPGFNNDSTYEGGNGIGVLHWLSTTKRYLQKSNFKNYSIELVGYSNYRNNEVFKLQIKSKGVRKSITYMYITMDTYALVAINQWYENDNRAIPKTMFYFTKWYEYVDFVKLADGYWYINTINDFRESISVDGNTTEIKRLIRLTNINEDWAFKEKNKITRETDLYKYPVVYNPTFWQNYNAPPETEEEKRVKVELSRE